METIGVALDHIRSEGAAELIRAKIFDTLVTGVAFLPTFSSVF